MDVLGCECRRAMELASGIVYKGMDRTCDPFGKAPDRRAALHIQLCYLDPSAKFSGDLVSPCGVSGRKHQAEVRALRRLLSPNWR